MMRSRVSFAQRTSSGSISLMSFDTVAYDTDDEWGWGGKKNKDLIPRGRVRFSSLLFGGVPSMTAHTDTEIGVVWCENSG